jgi:hypothetical protein
LNLEGKNVEAKSGAFVKTVSENKIYRKKKQNI